MAFHNQYREGRKASPYSQKELGVLIGTTQSNISKYENGDRPIPDDLVIKTLKILKNPRLKIAYEVEKQSSIINIPLLNNVDENEVVILDVLIEEAEEAIASANELKRLIRNRKSREEFSLSEWDRFMEYEEQIADLFPALKLHFVVMAERFGLDLDRLSMRLNAKYKSKNYLL